MSTLNNYNSNIFCRYWRRPLEPAFAGLSAAAVISPMLITFLGIGPYMQWE